MLSSCRNALFMRSALAALPARAAAASGPSSQLRPIASAGRPTTPRLPRLTCHLHASAACLAGPPRSPRSKIKVNPLTLRNGDIPHRSVQIVDEETNQLSEPVLLYQVLETFDHETHALKLVSEDPPVAKIVNIVEDRRKEREHDARLKLAKRLAVEDKELQVGWHGAPSDMQHKLQTARAIVEKGDRVHLVFANRVSGGGKRPKFVPDERKAQIISLFEDGMSDVASKWKEDERTKGLWVMYWHPQSSISTEVRAKVVDSIVDGKRRKEEQKEARRLKQEERVRKAKERQAEDKAKAAEVWGDV